MFISLLLLIVPSAVGAQQIPKAEHDYELGLTLKSEQRYREAVQEFKKAVEINPEFADAYYHLGLSYLKVGEPAEAIRYLLRLNQLEPGNLDAAIAAGKIYSRLGYFNDALALFLRTLQKRRDLPPMFDENEGARSVGEVYPKGNANAAEVSYYLGVLEVKAAHYRPAITDLRKAISVEHELGTPYCYLGEAYEHLGDLSQAEEALRRCLLRNPNFRSALQTIQEMKVEHR